MQHATFPEARRSNKIRTALAPLLALAILPACGSSTGPGAGGAGDATVSGSGGNAAGQGGAGATGAGGASTPTAGAGGVAGASGSAGSARDAGNDGAREASVPSGDAGCTPPPPQAALVGWASVAGMGVNTTTGGGGGATSTVTTLATFNARAGGTAPAIVQVMGTISGNMRVGSNKTIVGLCGAVLQGHLELSGSSNVIVRNLKLVGNNCTDSPTDCSMGADTISVSNASHHVWFDHDDISDGSDGNLDVNQASDLITISWTKFHYTARRTDPAGAGGGHEFSNLVSSSDTDTGDIGHLRITFHHNWWADNVYERMPRARFGQLHIFNNLYTSTGNLYCIGAGVGVNVLNESNVFIGVARPVDTTSFADATTIVHSANNIYTRAATPAELGGPVFTPPYIYANALDAASTIQAAVMAGAGPQ
jgi:pectate lyase